MRAIAYCSTHGAIDNADFDGVSLWCRCGLKAATDAPVDVPPARARWTPNGEDHDPQIDTEGMEPVEMEDILKKALRRGKRNGKGKYDFGNGVIKGSRPTALRYLTEDN